ncbi:hypothetical protein RIF29_05728 [Crotalaria pallida]|uniref:Uncharacterized protein n=1 Tax=Crotalaria pallida TaxID=3830 RepID=A0AAN9J2I1_CROPI
MEFAGLVRDVITNKVRATLILSRDQVEKLKKWISIRCATGYDSRTLYISTFVVTCALMWVCMIKFEEIKDHDNNHVTKSCDELCHLVFLADCRDCLELSLPSTYFGNCLATGIVKIKRDVLLEENSIIEVASAIESEVRNLKSTNTTILKKFETLMTDLKELGKPGKNVLTIAGSPKLAIYDTDFRWGRPKKSDIVHIESSGSISLSDCREKKDGIEVGLALDRVRMRNFITFFEKYLNNIIA